jgi:hypothetical protein
MIDVLTMSKLDSGLFVMTPIDVQTESIARNVVKMFEGEAKAADIDLQFRLEDSCKEVGFATVSLDPTRVTQILIVRSLLCFMNMFAANQQGRILLPTRSSSPASSKHATSWSPWACRLSSQNTIPMVGFRSSVHLTR